MEIEGKELTIQIVNYLQSCGFRHLLSKPGRVMGDQIIVQLLPVKFHARDQPLPEGFECAYDLPDECYGMAAGMDKIHFELLAPLVQDLQYDAYLYRFNPLNDLIIDGVHELVVEVIPLETEPEIDRSQVHYYGDDYGYPLLFQTVNHAGQTAQVIQEAILWYAARRLDYPQMELRNSPL